MVGTWKKWKRYAKTGDNITLSPEAAILKNEKDQRIVEKRIIKSNKIEIIKKNMF